MCEVVPALREAIKQEEEAGTFAICPEMSVKLSPSMSFDVETARAADEEAAGRGKRKRKPKGAVAEEVNVEKGVDGRAGPKSENVVLQKSAYYRVVVLHGHFGFS